MKADKYLFGLACLGMGYMIHSTVNKTPSQDFGPKTILTDSINKNAVSHELAKDTLDFSKVAKRTVVKAVK